MKEGKQKLDKNYQKPKIVSIPKHRINNCQPDDGMKGDFMSRI